MDIVAETTILRNSPSQFMARVLNAWIARRALILALPLVVTGALAVHRYEWIIVGLALLLLIYPFLLIVVYFNYGLRNEAANFILPLKLAIGQEGIDIVVFHAPTDANSDNTDETVPQPREKFRCHYDLKDILRVASTAKETVIYFRSPRYASLRIADSEWLAGEGADNPKNAVVKLFLKNGIKFA